MENMRIAAEENHKIGGDGPFTAKCSKWLEERMGIDRVLLTSSCTHALEMTMHLLKIEPGDEVITPSYTFCSAADAIALRGGVPVFVDIRPDTMNIDDNLRSPKSTESMSSRTRRTRRSRRTTGSSWGPSAGSARSASTRPRTTAWERAARSS